MNKLPVYLFLGFLESGKTTFIQKTISNDKFGNGMNVLLLVCEEGFNDYDFIQFKGKNVSLQVIEDKSELNEQFLRKTADANNADIVVVELNGMWHLTDFLLNKPENWKVFQTVFIADASSFNIYVQNLKSLVVDELNVCDVVIFNRYTNKADVNELHKIVRSVNRKAEIYFEADNGMMIADDIEDPLPYDITADTILVKDEDYAIWYSDIMNEAKKYNGKTVKFKAIITSGAELPNNVFAVGRYIMTCCEADMQFCRFVALCNRYYPLQGEKWVSLTAEITVQHHETQNIDIPLLRITQLYECEPPEVPIANYI